MTNEKIKIEDNFLVQEDFDKIQKRMMGYSFPWFYNDGDKDMKYLHFQHTFEVSKDENMSLILAVLNPVSVFRIRALLLAKTSIIVESTLHSDLFGAPEEKIKQWTTSIFYVNTNNGYTKFEDGTKVESVANRMLTFPTNMKHAGTSCTDEKTRVVINFNYKVKNYEN